MAHWKSTSGLLFAGRYHAPGKVFEAPYAQVSAYVIRGEVQHQAPEGQGQEVKVRVVVAFAWDGARRIRELGEFDPDPTEAELDAIAEAILEEPRQDGVLPHVRVLEARTSRLPTEVVP